MAESAGEDKLPATIIEELGAARPEGEEPFADAVTVAQVQGAFKRAGIPISTKPSGGKYIRTTGVYADAVDRDGKDSTRKVRKKYKNSRGQGSSWMTVDEPVREAVVVGYHSNSGPISTGQSRDSWLPKAVEALKSAGFTVTPVEGNDYKFLVTKKAKPTPESETTSGTFTEKLDAARPESASQEALEEAYKELRAANRVQMMEPKATADKKLNGDDYSVMDILRYGSVIDITDIKDEVEAGNIQFSPGGSLPKTIASLKKKGILTTVPDDKNRLALTESGIEKVAIVQAGMDKERRDAEENSQARIDEADANIAAKEAAKTPEQRAQEEADLAEFRANQAALAKKRIAEDEKNRLFYETNLTPSENGAIKFLQDALLDDDLSSIDEGSVFDKENFEESLKDNFGLQARLPEGQTPSSLTEELVSSLKKKGFITTVRGEKELLALTKLGAEKVKESLGLSSKTESLSSDKDSKPTKSRNKPLDIDLSDFDFDDDTISDVVETVTGPLDTPQAIAASALQLANSTGLGMRKGKTNDRVISAEPSGDATSLDRSISADKPSQQAIDTKDQVVALGESLLTLAEQSILDKLVESGTIPEGTTPEGLHRMVEEFTNKRDEMSDSLIEGRKNFKSKLSQVVATALNGLSDEQIAKIKEEAMRVLSGTSVLTNLERGASLDSPMLLAIDSSYKSWFPKFSTGIGYDYGIDGSFSTYDPDATGTYNDFFAWIAIKDGLVDVSELEADAEKLKDLSKKYMNLPRPQDIMGVYQKELAKSIHDRLKETGIEFDSVPLESLFAGYMPKARRYSNISKGTKKELEAALQFIPKDILESAAQWLEDTHKGRSKDGIAKIRLISSSTRAQFQREYDEVGGPIRVLAIKGGGVSDYLHEIWHFIQLINPNIGVLENAYMFDRTADSQGKLNGKLDIYGNGKETGISQTGIVSAYTTRQYEESGNKTFSPKNRFTELITTTVEDLFTNPGFYSTPKGITAVVGKGKNRRLYTDVFFDKATNSWYHRGISGASKIKITPTALYGRKISDGVDRDIKSFGIGMILTLAGLKNSGK